MAEELIRSEVPPKGGVPRWLIIVGVVIVLICLCGVGAMVITLLSPTLNAARLPDICMQNNPGMDRQACTTWSENVRGTTEFDDCFQQGMSSGQPDADKLYACLVEKGVGPD